MFDFLVIGNGLMGSAAARYLSARSDSVCVVGQAEPADWVAHDGVFASHYDQGRITRRLSRDMVWATLADWAIQQYAGLQERSGITFYNPVGGLYVAPRGSDGQYAHHVADTAAKLGIEYQLFENADAIRAAHPMYQFPPNCDGVGEAAPAGYINPRDLIRAQNAVARQQGATVMADQVLSLERSAEHLTANTRNHGTLQARQVLLAIGAYGNTLVPHKLALRVKSETIILARVSAEIAASLSDMPFLTWDIESPDIDDIYLLPPIHYPDGHFYIKMGANTRVDQWFETPGQMREWMVNGESDVVKSAMRSAIEQILPTADVQSWHTNRCLVTYTPHGKPFVDKVADRLFIVTAGNGSSAKCSDTLGRLAAERMLGEWTFPFSAETFRVVFEEKKSITE